MKYSWYFRLDVRRGVTEQLPFGDIDGHIYGVYHERGEAVRYTRNVALEIVNRWNSINDLARNTIHSNYYIYWIV